MWRHAKIEIASRGRAARVRDSAIRIGICQLFLRHTSANLCITENSDPQVRHDLERFARRMRCRRRCFN
jgi:thiamine phosphate synthase YjbQ (UPF0047 family)